jgi:hypothetical protein
MKDILVSRDQNFLSRKSLEGGAFANDVSLKSTRQRRQRASYGQHL